MPFRSEAQKAKFRQLVKEGKMTEEQYAEWDKDTPAELPERISRERKTKNPSWGSSKSVVKPKPVGKR